MTHSEMPIFVRRFDFPSWLIPMTNHFPKAQRFSVTSRSLNASFEMREKLGTAQHRRGKERLHALSLADESLSVAPQPSLDMDQNRPVRTYRTHGG